MDGDDFPVCHYRTIGGEGIDVCFYVVLKVICGSSGIFSLFCKVKFVAVNYFPVSHFHTFGE